MPRTVEHIVECHQAAADLRAQGKPIWARQIKLKDILERDQYNESDEHVRVISSEMAARVRESTPKAWLDIDSDHYDRDLDEIVENLEVLKDLEDTSEPLVEEFNGRLEELYDWADRRRVWIS